MTFTLAIIGRPNVGKSTLFNRLTGRRAAIVDDMPGVTRDVRRGKANLGGLDFDVLDTAGLDEAKEGTLASRMTELSKQAVAQCDVVLMLMDGRAGITPSDEHFARWIRKQKKPVILAVNKAEGRAGDHAIAEAHRLGLGEPVAISAEHGEGMGELFEALSGIRDLALGIREETDIPNAQSPITNPPLQIAIVGRPNAGKSTLFNQILGEERTLTGPEAGITRDAIMVDFTFEGRPLKLVDTAGMRKKANVQGKVEKLAVADSIDTLQFAHVVILLLDATQPLEKQDNAIAALVEQEGRALVIAVNKWDLIDDKMAYVKAIHQRLEKVLPQVKGVPVVPVSGLTGHNVDKLLRACLKMYALWNTEISTGQLNRWLEAAVEINTPPLIAGRRIKIRYMTQKTARPPTFLLFSNMGESEIPESYQRYLVNSMREAFDLPGVPIRLRVKKNKNPYAGGE
ncbi:MAG: ribosome biogenesis GTPase Der [Alphaproteobacteria bacterium]|nr:ribosome biogenesis GTPase Der [Alphaproteobacteria bacterium]